jgi:hypothetical protein
MRLIPGIGLLVLCGSAGHAVDFNRDVRPILEARCVACHGPKKQRGDLRLDLKVFALKGGESGPVIKPASSADSLLFTRVSSDDPQQRMPPSGERLTKDQLKVLRDWIDQGAPWIEITASDPSKNHWAFKPVVRPPIPTGASDWGRNPIDQFITARLRKDGLEPSPEADRAPLIRRLKFDLLGLPPTPEEVEAFIKDKRPTAYDELVERYLASPAFGERWARHWLDVVRFAETTGFETNAFRPTAWPYRDYVIRAFNDDLPYNRFIQEQLAGDQFGADEATGYLVAGAYDEVKGDPALNAQQRADELHDMIGTTGGTFFGLTVGCARCHNHKFDPISQVDYYGIKAMFEGVRFPEGRDGRPGNRQRQAPESAVLRKQLAEIEREMTKLGRPPVNARKNEERFAPVEARFLRLTITETAGGTQPCVDEIEVFAADDPTRNVALASLGTRVTANGTLPGYAIHKLAHINDGKYGNSWSWISSEASQGWVQLEFVQPVRINRILWSRDRNENGFADRVPTSYRFESALKPGEWKTVARSEDRLPAAVRTPEQAAAFRELSARQKALEARLTSMTVRLIHAGRFVPPEPTYRLHRGDPKERREQVTPTALANFGAALRLPADAPEPQRRLALARWIADPKHPLTARVMVNRLWQYHFGAGIVATPSDFGLNGARPTHPELLDWLADEFVASGWRMKHLHRLIVLSSAYRQASASTAKGLSLDAASRMLWRYPPRRLEAEPLRDAILFVSGKLDRTMGGPGFDLFEPRGNTPQGVKLYVPKTTFGPTEWRRMIYQSKPRMRLDDTFGAFDCPDAGQTAPKRTVSTTPLQVLNLINSPFMLQQASFFAERLHNEAATPAEQVRRGCQIAYQRLPDAEELGESLKLIREHGLRAFCLALLNCNEFLFVF